MIKVNWSILHNLEPKISLSNWSKLSLYEKGRNHPWFKIWSHGIGCENWWKMVFMWLCVGWNLFWWCYWNGSWKSYWNAKNEDTMCPFSWKSSQLGFKVFKNDNYERLETVIKVLYALVHPNIGTLVSKNSYLNTQSSKWRFYFSEYKVPDVTYPDFDNIEVKNETDEWQKLFYFTLEECQLEDFQETVNIIWFQTQNSTHTVWAIL